MQFCKITHIFREANQVADYMARLAFQGDFVRNDAREMDFSCNYLLQADAYAIQSGR